MKKQAIRSNPYTAAAKTKIKNTMRLHKINPIHFNPLCKAASHYDMEPEDISRVLAMGLSWDQLLLGKSRVKSWLHALEELDFHLRDQGIVTDEIWDFDEEFGPKNISIIQKTLKKAGIDLSSWYIGLFLSYTPFTAIAAASGDKEAMIYVVESVAEQQAEALYTMPGTTSYVEIADKIKEYVDEALRKHHLNMLS